MKIEGGCHDLKARHYNIAVSCYKVLPAVSSCQSVFSRRGAKAAARRGAC